MNDVNTDALQNTQLQSCAPRRHPVLAPRADIVETETAFELIIDVPGVSADGVNVTYEDNVLTVHAAANDSAPNGRFIVREYAVGDYRRTFRLGENIDRDNIAAELQHGVLRLTLPKTQQAQPRRINVTTG